MDDVKCPKTINLNTVEAIEPSQADKEAVAQLETKLPKLQRKTTPRKELALKIKDMDPAECGPPCATAHVPDQILQLKQEFADVFPETMPPGLPPERRTDHRIDFVPDFRIPGTRLYRHPPAEDAVLIEHLEEMLRLGFV